MDRVTITLPNSQQGTVSRTELVRLLADGLRDLGYTSSARALEMESGFDSSSNVANEFMTLLSARRYDAALGLLDRLPFKEGSLGRMRARNLIIQERYLNCLFEEKLDEALTRLHEEVFFLNHEEDSDLDALSAMLACSTPDDLRKYSSRFRARQAKRFCSAQSCVGEESSAADCIRALLDSEAVVPHKRLLCLLGQALVRQVGEVENLGRLEDEPLPLLRDLSEVEEQRNMRYVPSSLCRRVVPISTGAGLVEIWSVCFEDDDRASRIAVGTRDGSVHIIETSSGTILESHYMVFESDGRPIVRLDWSSSVGLLAVSREARSRSDSEDSDMPTRSTERNGSHASLVRRILPSNGELQPARAVNHAGRPIARWTHRGGIVTAGADGWIRQFNSSLQLENSVKAERVIDIAMSPDRTIAFMACADKTIRGYSGVRPVFNVITSSEPIIALACGANSLAASLRDQSLSVWSLRDITQTRSTEKGESCFGSLKFKGFTRKRYVLCPSVGSGDIIATGSEDGAIHVYSCFSVAGPVKGEVALLRGHTAAVNEVCFAPKVPGMLASVGDDGSLRIWTRRTSQDETSSQ